MLFRKIGIVILSIFTASVVFAERNHSFYLEESAPGWIKSLSVPQEVSSHFIEVNLQYLLFDMQKNWEEKATFYHYATKAVTEEGVKGLSRIHIDFQPEFQKLIVHSIRIWRDQQFSDRMAISERQVLQREPELENDIYMGGLTLVYFIDDIRPGDILEYSYSLVGEHPVAAPYFSEIFSLQSSSYLHQIYQRLLIDPRRDLEIKTFNSLAEPQMNLLSANLQEWSWEVEDSFPYFQEPRQPGWHFANGCVQVSEYKTWEQVVQQLIPLYTLSPEVLSNPGQEIQALIDDWCASTPHSTERALLALRFIQDQLHYFGFEEGIHSFQPHDPRLVLKRRYGDCKDKTFLLHTMLHLMGISSTPVLVNLNRGESLCDFLPTPFIFDHIVLRIDLDGRSFYVDPTWSKQGGSLFTNCFPDFYWGLPLEQTTKELFRLPALVSESPIEIQTTFTFTEEDSAEMQVKRTFSGSKADVIRNYLGWLGHLYLSAYFLDDMEKIYGTVDLLSQSLEDDRENNLLTLTDVYCLNIPSRQERKFLKVCPLTTNAYLLKGINPDRLSPLALSYPLWVKEEIHIENPFINWKSSTDYDEKSHESVHYRRQLKKGGTHAELQFEIQYLKDHVPLDSLEDFWSVIEEIGQDSTFKVDIVPFIDHSMRFFEVAGLE